MDVVPVDVDLVEYRRNTRSDLDIHKWYLEEYVNGRRTEFSKCLKCGERIKRPNSSTTGLITHHKTCAKESKKRPSGQSALPFAKAVKTGIPKGIQVASRLVCEDNIPLHKVVNSRTLKTLFRKQYGVALSRYAINESIEADYQAALRNIKRLIANRGKTQMMSISFDKWTSADGNKYIGVYLYCGETICLGLIHYTGFCGSEEVCTLLKNHLKLFGVMPSDIMVSTTDCGSDVQNVAQIFGWFAFPCLARVINLIVKRFLCSQNEIDDDMYEVYDPESGEADDMADGYYNEKIELARTIVRKIKRSSKLQEKLEELQRGDKSTITTVVMDNATRWNSVFDMIVRFIQLKKSLRYMFEDELENFDWEHLRRLEDTLKSFKKATLFLEKGSSGPRAAISVIKYLNYLAAKKPNLREPIRTVLDKWVDKNHIVNGLLNGRGVFYDALRERLTTDSPGDDHEYGVPDDLSIEEIELRMEAENFDLVKYMENFKPTSVDSERLFSFCRISKDYLQNRMRPDVHARNVFLNKNQRFLPSHAPAVTEDIAATTSASAGSSDNAPAEVILI